MNIEPVEFDIDSIQEPARKLKYQVLDRAIKEPGRTFFIDYLSRQAFAGLKNGKTQIPGDRSRFKFKQDLAQPDKNNASKFAVYVRYQ